MKLLLDTHVVLWWLLEPDKLPKSVRIALQDAEGRYVSAASALEIGLKWRTGKLPPGNDVLDRWEKWRGEMQAANLPLEVTHMRRAGTLDWQHRDPFDRMLVAQAQTEGLILATTDRRIRQFAGVSSYWTT